MDLLLQQLQFSLSVTGPICLMLFLGIYFRRSQLIDDHFIDVASRLVFKVTLPALLFLSIVNSNHDVTAGGALVLYGLASNFTFFLLISLVVRRYFKQAADQGVIIQGAFRGNTAIIGLALIANAYGNDGLAQAALYVAALTLLFNVQAVLTLTPKGSQSGMKALVMILRTLTKNPLIIAILLGLGFSRLNLTLPDIATTAGQYFANMTLPLALICGGGSLDIRQLNHDKAPAWSATAFKLLLCPALITFGAWLSGFRGAELGIIYLCSSAPAAAASYVMARAMGGNATLAANIIVLTTLLSLLTTTLGVFMLSSLALI
ncbi:AEC family transporter [Vibrio mangrovi]|uniref:AEC family transporter n=1 Tax=Vibrio mangrovi TaxID=474394 RepID=A0A1Y6IVZ4_9VIBR|nr:AEC family transporter [Vibrio mangrovi]MDW6005020.1 AEC family transporter [Vibrio mangrovi]SMS01788.1 Membrane transport protein [Vibrio mangrovi]